MARDKAKDDRSYNCSQKHEQDYVVGLYSSEKQSNVRNFLISGCNTNLIYNSTHKQVYELIKKHLGYDVPN